MIASAVQLHKNFPELRVRDFSTAKIRCDRIIHKLTEDYYNYKHSQVELLVPHWVEVSKDGLGPSFGLSHLDRDVGITGTSLVLGL